MFFNALYCVIGDPTFLDDHSANLTLMLGEKGVIDFNASLGVPERVLDIMKDGALIEDMPSEGGRLVIGEVAYNHGGKYRAQFRNRNTARTITVTVVDQDIITSAVGKSITITPKCTITPNCTPNCTCQHWERDDVELQSNVEYQITGGELSIAALSSEDVGRVFACVAEEGRLRLETTLHSRENLSLCVKREQNPRQVTRVLRVSQH